MLTFITILMDCQICTCAVTASGTPLSPGTSTVAIHLCKFYAICTNLHLGKHALHNFFGFEERTTRSLSYLGCR